MSLDTLRADRFRALTRRDAHAQVLGGLEAAHRAGFRGTKIDSVVVRGVNDDELADLLEFGKQQGAEVRFIEYMDVGGATEWSMDKVFSRAEILELLSRRYGKIVPVVGESSAPAERFLLPDGIVFGIIASTTTPFCSRCDRSRLTADGMWYICLYAQQGTDLRQPLRAGASRDELTSAIASAWQRRNDRGAEERKVQRFRGVFVGIEQLRQDPHLEMHTRGGYHRAGWLGRRTMFDTWSLSLRGLEREVIPEAEFKGGRTNVLGIAVGLPSEIELHSHLRFHFRSSRQSERITEHRISAGH
jgi:GTP 3',8-cyclase